MFTKPLREPLFGTYLSKWQQIIVVITIIMFANYSLLEYACGCSDCLSVQWTHWDSWAKCPVAVTLSFRRFFHPCSPMMTRAPEKPLNFKGRRIATLTVLFSLVFLLILPLCLLALLVFCAHFTGAGLTQERSLPITLENLSIFRQHLSMRLNNTVWLQLPRDQFQMPFLLLHIQLKLDWTCIVYWALWRDYLVSISWWTIQADITNAFYKQENSTQGYIARVILWIVESGFKLWSDWSDVGSCSFISCIILLLI